MRRLAIAVVLLAGCQEADEDCDPESDRRGLYLFTMTEVSGTCGPIEPVVLELPAAIDPNCMLERNVWSEDMCANDTRVRCEFEDEIGPWTMIFGGVLTQHDSSGETLSGQIEMEQSDADGVICRSTYDVEYERQ